MYIIGLNSTGSNIFKTYLPIRRNSSAMVINMVTDIKQTCLGQGLGVAFTAHLSLCSP